MNLFSTLAASRFGRICLVITTLALGLGVGFTARDAVARPRAVAPYASTFKVPTIAQTGVDPDALTDPFTIAAQRQRSYQGGLVKTERSYPGGEGYKLEQLSFPSDGLKEYALAAVPDRPVPAGGFPVVILIHGHIPPYDYTSDEAFYTAYAADLAKAGYLVVKPDLRGYGQSAGTAEGAYYSPAYTADVLNLTASLANYRPANANRVALFGHSMGAHVALNVLAVAPTRFKAAVLASGSIGTTTDVYQNWQASSDLADPVTIGTRDRIIALYGQPADDSPFWRSVSPYGVLKDIRLPVQLQYAADDDTVPPRFSAEFAQAMAAAGNPPDVKRYPVGGHPLSSPAHEQSVADMVGLFTAKL